MDTFLKIKTYTHGESNTNPVIPHDTEDEKEQRCSAPTEEDQLHAIYLAGSSQGSQSGKRNRTLPKSKTKALTLSIDTEIARAYEPYYALPIIISHSESQPEEEISASNQCPVGDSPSSTSFSRQPEYPVYETSLGVLPVSGSLAGAGHLEDESGDEFENEEESPELSSSPRSGSPKDRSANDDTRLSLPSLESEFGLGLVNKLLAPATEHDSDDEAKDSEEDGYGLENHSFDLSPLLSSPAVSTSASNFDSDMEKLEDSDSELDFVVVDSDVDSDEDDMRDGKEDMCMGVRGIRGRGNSDRKLVVGVWGLGRRGKGGC
ncbi:hypothetical protein ONS96_003713 [Cadophora gregata f. sp. sojae]|nr:hypothetical protein ONS96_003713 [Cadophora gregata f. sp. sojae]